MEMLDRLLEKIDGLSIEDRRRLLDDSDKRGRGEL